MVKTNAHEITPHAQPFDILFKQKRKCEYNTMNLFIALQAE